MNCQLSSNCLFLYNRKVDYNNYKLTDIKFKFKLHFKFFKFLNLINVLKQVTSTNSKEEEH